MNQDPTVRLWTMVLFFVLPTPFSVGWLHEIILFQPSDKDQGHFDFVDDFLSVYEYKV